MSESDSLTRRIAELEGATERFRNTAEGAQLEHAAMLLRYLAIQGMHTWPVDIETEGRFFSLHTLLLCILTTNLITESGIADLVAKLATQLF